MEMDTQIHTYIIHYVKPYACDVWGRWCFKGNDRHQHASNFCLSLFSNLESKCVQPMYRKHYLPYGSYGNIVVKKYMNIHNSSSLRYIAKTMGELVYGQYDTMQGSLEDVLKKRKEKYSSYGGSCLYSRSPLMDQYGNTITPGPCPDHLFCT